MSTQFVVSLPSFHLPLKKNQSPTRLLLPTKCFSVSRSIAPPLTLTKSGFCSHISSLSVISKNIEGFGDFELIGGRISTTSRGGGGIKASVRKTGNKTLLKSKRSSRKRLPPIQPGDRIDYRNISLISRFVSEQGKILSRRINRLTLKQQRLVTSAIKQARILSLLPFLNNEKQYEATASRRAEANSRSGGFRARKR